MDSVVVSTRLMDVTRLQMLQAICTENGVELSRMHFELHELVAVSSLRQRTHSHSHVNGQALLLVADDRLKNLI